MGMESEKELERYLCQLVRGLDGEAYKFVSPMRRFVPDRICILPHGITWFIEIKSTGQKPHPGQLREIERLQAKGHKALCVDSVAGINKAVQQMRKEIDNARCGNHHRCITKYDEPPAEDECFEEE